LFTQQAEQLLTQTPFVTVTQLPDTGFGDNVGIPGLLALAASLIVIIFLARRLRMAQ
jgi:LPXTG-motif cell wall-anchored protein